MKVFMCVAACGRKFKWHHKLREHQRFRCHITTKDSVYSEPKRTRTSTVSNDNQQPPKTTLLPVLPEIPSAGTLTTAPMIKCSTTENRFECRKCLKKFLVKRTMRKHQEKCNKQQVPTTPPVDIMVI